MVEHLLRKQEVAGSIPVVGSSFASRMQAPQATYDKKGPFRDSNPGPLRPKRRIIPLDQTANYLLLLDARLNAKFSPKHHGVYSAVGTHFEKIQHPSIELGTFRVLGRRHNQ